MNWIKQNRKLVGALVVTFSFLVFWRVTSTKAIEGKVAEIKNIGAHVETIAANGQLRPRQEIFLTLRKGGLVDFAPTTINEVVKKEQVLVTVDSRTNRAALERAMSQFKFASAEHQRNSRLLSSRVGTRQAYEESLNQINVARTQLEEARQRIEDTMVRSPIDGVLSFLPFKVGDYVPDGSRVAVVEDRTAVELTARIPQTFAKLFPRDALLTISKADQSESMNGSIGLVDPDQVSGAQDIDIRIQFSTLPQKFKIRDFVDVRIPLEEFQNVSVVPSEFVMSASAKPFIFILKDGQELQKKELEVISIREGKFYVKNLVGGEQAFLPFQLKGLDQKVGKRIAIKER